MTLAASNNDWAAAMYLWQLPHWPPAAVSMRISRIRRVVSPAKCNYPTATLALHSHCTHIAFVSAPHIEQSHTDTQNKMHSCTETEIKTQTQLNFSLHSLRNCKHILCKSKQLLGFDSLTVCLSHWLTGWLTPAWMCQSNGRTARISVCGGATSILTQFDLSRAQIVAVNNRSDICSDKYEQMKDSWVVSCIVKCIRLR